MKKSTWFIMIVALFLVGSLALVGQTSAADKFTPFEGTDTFDPFGPLFGRPAVGALGPLGDVTCPGHESVDLTLPSPPFPPNTILTVCPTGSRTHIRGLVLVTRFETTSDLVTGTATITVNSNFDADGTGPAWGTISIAPEAGGGTWDGTWQGVRVKVDDQMDDQTWAILVHGSAKGTGEFEGMIYSALDDITSYSLVLPDGRVFPSVLVAYFGNLTGRIIDPHFK